MLSVVHSLIDLSLPAMQSGMNHAETPLPDHVQQYLPELNDTHTPPDQHNKISSSPDKKKLKKIEKTKMAAANVNCREITEEGPCFPKTPPTPSPSWPMPPPCPEAWPRKKPESSLGRPMSRGARYSRRSFINVLTPISAYWLSRSPLPPPLRRRWSVS